MGRQHCSEVGFYALKLKMALLPLWCNVYFSPQWGAGPEVRIHNVLSHRQPLYQNNKNKNCFFKFSLKKKADYFLCGLFLVHRFQSCNAQQTFSFSSSTTWLFIVAFTSTQHSTVPGYFSQGCAAWPYLGSAFIEPLCVLKNTKRQDRCAFHCFLPTSLWFCGCSGGQTFFLLCYLQK